MEQNNIEHSEIIDLIQKILRSNYLPVYRFQLPYGQLEMLDLGLRKNILGIENAFSSLEDLLKSLDFRKIYFCTDIFHCTYAFLLLPDHNIFFCGPVLFEQLQNERFEEIFATLPISGEYRDALQNYYRKVSYQPSLAMFESLFMELGKALYGPNCGVAYPDTQFFDLWDSAYQKRLLDTEHPFSMIEIIENRYEAENALINAVSSGNVNAALEISSRFGSMFLPQRISNNLRDTKDYTITLNTLLRKAAERAGVHPIHIDMYSNSVISLIESLTSSSQCSAAQRKIINGYCQLVKDYKQNSRSPILRKVIAYIDTDLEADLSLKNLSEHLGVNASYLSTLFSKEMGMSLTDYVNKSRLDHAKLLLANTELPIKTIALRCGIADIHYFSRLFKRNIGMTPKTYRDTSHPLLHEKLPKQTADKKKTS